ncbi:MAG: hypothetical protein HY059_07490 [Proteobacteria bacterium]|nr:hypothetical protein [Pseudomonadota bacterium]
MNPTGSVESFAAYTGHTPSSEDFTGAGDVLTPALRNYVGVGIVTLLLSLPATGGSLSTASLQNAPQASGMALHAYVSHRRHRSAARRVRVSTAVVDTSPRQQIGLVRTTFSVPVRDLASIFGVSRAMVYRWSNGAAAPRSRARERLAQLTEIAEAWNATGQRPLAISLRGKRFEGRSLLDLLSADPLDPSKILSLLQQQRLGRGVVAKPLDLDAPFTRRGLKRETLRFSTDARDDEKSAVAADLDIPAGE